MPVPSGCFFPAYRRGATISSPLSKRHDKFCQSQPVPPKASSSIVRTGVRALFIEVFLEDRSHRAKLGCARPSGPPLTAECNFWGKLMKKTLLSLAAATLLSATAAQAGSMADPVIEQDVIVTDTAANSSGNAMVLLLVLTAVIVAAATD